MSSKQDAVERLPVDTIRSRLRREINRFDTKMHLTNRDVSLRQTLMQAEYKLEAQRKENALMRSFMFGYGVIDAYNGWRATQDE